MNPTLNLSLPLRRGTTIRETAGTNGFGFFTPRWACIENANRFEHLNAYRDQGESTICHVISLIQAARIWDMACGELPMIHATRSVIKPA